MAHARSLIHQYRPNGEKYKPTIKPTPGFSPTADAEHLKKAMRGLGTDEQGIVNILGNRTSAERMAIRDAYPTISSKTLQEALESEISGKFLELALVLIKSPWQVMAEGLYKAMKGAGTKERVLNEILAGLSKGDVEELKKVYPEVSGGESLEDAIKGDTSGHYCEALLLTLAGQMDEPQTMQLKGLSPESVKQLINPGLAETDAKELYEAGEGRMGTADSRFMRPIINRTTLQLSATNDAYIRQYGKPLVEAIMKETSRDLEDYLVAKVRYATDRAGFFAEQLHDAISGAGTRDCTLQRILALRADIDLESIKEKYAELYGETLEDAVKGDTTGDYEKLCLKLLGSA